MASKKARRLALAAIAAAVGIGGGYWAWSMLGDGARADPDDAAQVARGRAVYGEHCASCHGAKLEGQPTWRTRKPDGRLPAPPHDATGHTWHHPDEMLFGITKKGVSAFAPPNYATDMPAFGGVLGDDDIWAVLAFIKSKWPAHVRARQPGAGKDRK